MLQSEKHEVYQHTRYSSLTLESNDVTRRCRCRPIRPDAFYDIFLATCVKESIEYQLVVSKRLEQNNEQCGQKDNGQTSIVHHH